MKHYLLLAFVLLLAACDDKQDASTQVSEKVKEDTTTSTEETRTSFTVATWVHGGKSYDEAIWTYKLERYDSIGISEILVSGDPELLQQVVNLAKNYNIKVHGWMWTLNRPGDSTAMEHPEWYAVNRNGDNSLDYRAYVDYYQWLSPFSPGARAYIKSNVRERLAIEGLASVHLDYVRYVDVILGRQLQKKYDIVQDRELPEYDYGYHPIAREGFKAIFGYDPLDLQHPELSTEWRQYRLNAVTGLVNECATLADSAGMHLSAAVFPFPEMSRHMVKQAWNDWHLDKAYPMIYQNFYDESVNWIGFVTRQCKQDVDFPVIAGLYSPGLREPENLEKALHLAFENGADGISIFQVDDMTHKQLEVLCAFIDQHNK